MKDYWVLPSSDCVTVDSVKLNQGLFIEMNSYSTLLVGG